MKTHHAAVESLPAVQEHWGAVGAMSLCVALLIAAEFMPVSLLTPIASDLGASDGQAGLAISISGLFAVVASLLVTRVCAHHERRHVLMVLALVMLLSLILICSPGGERLGKESGNWRLVFALLGLMLVYGLALGWLGFLIATILFLIGGILLMGERSLAFACKVSIPFTLIFWALLTKGLNVYLEPGRLFTQLLG